MVMNVTGGFMLYPANQARAFFDNDTYQLGEDLQIESVRYLGDASAVEAAAEAVRRQAG